MSTLFGDESVTQGINNQDKNNEWYTPAKYIEAARMVMGGIDLDPASTELANQTVKATRFYSQQENGLVRPWSGRLWLNPPFGKIPSLTNEGRSLIGHFVRKLVNEYRLGHIEQAVLLTTMQSNASWFQLLWDFPICFSDHRVHFNKIMQGKLVKDSNDSHMLGTIFVYLGPNEAKFIEVFSQFGRIVRAIDTPKLAQATQSALWSDGSEVA